MNRMALTSKRDRLRGFLTRHQQFAGVIALICLVSGVVLSRRLPPGVRVEKVTIAGDTPALKFIPAGAGPHPVALLAHGYSATKETLFWYGEALAAAGFVCYSVDLPGHGESPRLFSFVETARAIGDFARAIGPVDVFLGHSMGGGAGGETVREGLLRPKLVIAAGSDPQLGKDAPPLLFLVGRFDEFVKSDELKTRLDARLVISPWSDHSLELFDPLLIHAAVNAASVAIGKVPPAPDGSWRWHVLGILLTLCGASGLALDLPRFPPRWEWAGGIIVAVLYGGACFLTLGPFLGLKPHPQNFLPQIITAAIALAVLVGAGKWRVPRWIFAALAVAIAMGGVLASNSFPARSGISLFYILRFSQVFAPALIVGTIVGSMAVFRGSRFRGDVAMAVIVGCALFQLGNAPRSIPPSTKAHHFIKLDAKLGDACVGQYEFALNNIFRSPTEIKIWRARRSDVRAGHRPPCPFGHPRNISRIRNQLFPYGKRGGINLH